MQGEHWHLHVVKVVGLKMILEAAVTGTRRKQEMNAVPQEMKRGADKRQIGQDAGVVIEVLHGVHAKAGEGFDVGVTVVQRVHKGENWLEVQQAVGKVEVNCSQGSERGDGAM